MVERIILLVEDIIRRWDLILSSSLERSFYNPRNLFKTKSRVSFQAPREL